MTPFKTVSEKLSAWRRYREVVRELAQLSDYELPNYGTISVVPSEKRSAPGLKIESISLLSKGEWELSGTISACWIHLYSIFHLAGEKG